MASKATLENGLRKKFLDMITKMVSDEMDIDTLPVSASELTIPCLDEEGNEKFVLIKVSVPRGTRNGEGGYDAYDGYAAAEDYRAEQESKAQEKAVKKAMKEAEKGKKKKNEDGE
jgi:hypothetical protein